MRNSIKAALAATAGGGLLLGGAGSLAYWQDAETDGPHTITSGQLDLSEPVCTDGWTDGTATNLDLAAFRIVPGDTLTRSCDFTVAIAGDNLLTELAFTKPALDTNTLAGELDYSATYDLNALGAADLGLYDNGNPAIENLADGDVITVEYTVALPFEVGVVNNDSNSGAEFTAGDTGLVGGELTAVLSALTLTVNQVAS
jgi:alternate signal-mediated exported protein